MIITLVLNFIASFIAMIFTIVPSVTVADIPLIGPDVYGYLTLAVGYWNTAEGILPYLGLVKDVFVQIILPFEASLLLIKVFFGARTPAHM